MFMGIYLMPKCLRKATSNSELSLLEGSYLADTGIGVWNAEVDCWASMSETQCLIPSRNKQINIYRDIARDKQVC